MSGFLRRRRLSRREVYRLICRLAERDYEDVVEE